MIPHRFLTLAAAATLLSACGDAPTRPIAANRLSLVALSGDGQIGKAGEWLPDPLVVRAVDATGVPVSRIVVTWSVTSGAGVLATTGHGQHSGITDSEGVAAATFRPSEFGMHTVTATIDNTRLPSSTPVGSGTAEFTADAQSVVITSGYWGGFFGPNGGEPITVPIGAIIEWATHSPWTVNITSRSIPAGASPFAATLEQGSRFEFVPDAVGTWEWTWEDVSPSGEVHPGELRRLTVTQP